MVEEESKKKDLKETKPLDKMTVKELKEIALEIPHDHENVAVSDMKKDELLTFIKEAREIKDEEPAKKKKKRQKKVTLSKQKIKEKISQLREEKKVVLETRDRKKIDLLRRRISRLKKQTRKIAQA
ncbi:MAG: transcription termination factor Rho [Deltaproteobacteria bacterium]|nr:transcription termination factor Rho [Deltaproteobacteria bacterium]